MGFHAPAVMIVAFIPMLLIAAACYYMNRADPDCGTSFTWVTRAMGPRLGWLTGWAIVVTDVIVMAALAYIAGVYTFLLFGLDAAATNLLDVSIVAAIWIIVMTWICWVGIELSARTSTSCSPPRSRRHSLCSPRSRSPRSTSATRAASMSRRTGSTRSRSTAAQRRWWTASSGSVHLLGLGQRRLRQ
jgi:hypothetical protein